MARMISAVFLTVCIFFISASFAEDQIFLREDFRSLDNWKPLYFPKIKAHTIYSIASEGSESALKAESNASASAMVDVKEIDIYKYPKIRWRWKVSNVYTKAVPGTKDGDDYPIRIYVLFKYDPARLGLMEKIKYNAAKVMYGEYPPDSTLSYVWASRPDSPPVMTSPYTDRAKLIALERGPEKAGQWVEESVDILQDYRKAFGIDPPAMASIAVMNDSDNTGEKSISYVGHIEVFR
ncbi:MAG TPA: DUF3047 domain-containing protein [Dissulfurispiraceae bacterium]|nr:DUF3047 domain-containing protein [Dissulfurispiraceae bacterium]